MLSKKRGFAPIAIVIIIVGLIAMGGGLYYLSKTTSSTKESANKNIQKQEQPSQPSQPSQTEPARTSSTITKPTTQPSTKKDCGTNYDCFIAAAKTCAITTMKTTVPVNFFGIILTTTTRFDMKGITVGKCTFTTTVLDQQAKLSPETIATMKSQGSTDVEIQAANSEASKQAKSTIGTVNTCSYSTTDLTEALERWKVGSFSTEDNTLGHCQTSNH